jgi:hypothetical protein
MSSNVSRQFRGRTALAKCRGSAWFDYVEPLTGYKYRLLKVATSLPRSKAVAARSGYKTPSSCHGLPPHTELFGLKIRTWVVR